MEKQFPLFKIANIGEGILYVMPAPGHSTLEAHLEFLSGYSIKRVVSLLTSAETAMLQLVREQSLCTNLDMDYLSCPIPDFGVPTDDAKTADLIEKIYTGLLANEHTVIHCHGGIGRSGIIAGGVLLRHGLSLDQTLETLYQGRLVEMPETDEQVEWMRNFGLSMGLSDDLI